MFVPHKHQMCELCTTQLSDYMLSFIGWNKAGQQAALSRDQIPCLLSRIGLPLAGTPQRNTNYIINPN